MASIFLFLPFFGDVEGGDAVGFGEGREIKDIFNKTVDVNIM